MVLVLSTKRENHRKKQWPVAVACLAFLFILVFLPQSERLEVEAWATEVMGTAANISTENVDDGQQQQQEVKGREKWRQVHRYRSDYHGDAEQGQRRLEKATSQRNAPGQEKWRQIHRDDKSTDHENSSPRVEQGWRQALPDANFTPTPDTQYELCFVTSVYSSSAKEVDQPPTVEAIVGQNPSFRFFAFTNLPSLYAPGWKVVVKPLDQYRRYITQSRWAKFMAWEDPEISLCQAVIYMDGFCRPKEKHAELYKRMAKAIYDSPEGLFQNLHEVNRGPMHELNRIMGLHKDVASNIAASKAWLLSRPDFHRGLPMYVNTFIGYNPKSDRFRQVAQFFWSRYSLELDSWRDQPLWSYSLYHFKLQPQRLGTYKALFQQVWRNMGRGGHRYNLRDNFSAQIDLKNRKQI